MNNIPLEELFNGMQEQMKAQLNTNRSFIEHPGSKGDALENAWIEWLTHYLPNRYSVDKAIIIDHKGNTSDQIDIVIYDNYFTPFIFSQNGFHYIPAEGVYAVFEVKPDIYGHIEYAGNKIASVRSLERTSTSMISSGHPLPARPLTKIVGGILATSNTYKKVKTIEDNLSKLKGLQTLDLGCAVESGSFSIDYIGQEDINQKNFNKRINDYYETRRFNKLTLSRPENSLITFFMQLTRYLQQAIGTIPAIDLQAYLNVLNEKIDPDI
ncbi:DUF6602 domain-containing protein [Psychrobacter sanguinis]|uniref:DUF6602 domain-containing protein n=1 Tax=Psychrobacter sanguinis TaxID=861445 RepID=UPI00020C7AEB|nr:DUF6602 domain-containing protein [Psychrobacter sanguinis]EGK11126.1 hypothetical protein HMPREF9373_1836 [Psychrobacter sp. 1501(2011)]MCC3307400.1 hypothetical protein [Psychrobacter sanguinis]MCD9152681.1 hypothetical protein [Psychrobacter sanguinis]MDY3305697.1 DUF6602 domain-containing protein [Psychrobacter sanguinis]UEC24737.1 hypothetical protein LK453_09275 [Psychrobacter sanguinis]